jgi:hypothetical protein
MGYVSYECADDNDGDGNADDDDDGARFAHLHLEVEICVCTSCDQIPGPDPNPDDGRWQRGSVDHTWVRVDAQPLIEASCGSVDRPDCPGEGSGGTHTWCDAIASFSGLTQFEAGATNEQDDDFGRSVTTGDFNGDGRADIALGVPREDWGTPQVIDQGLVIVYYGPILGFTPGTERPGQNQAGDTAEPGDNFGWALASGDFNADGNDDLALAQE